MSTVENNNKIASGDQDLEKATEKLNGLSVNETGDVNNKKRGENRERHQKPKSNRVFPSYEEQVAKIEEAQKNKEVVEKKVRGKVRWFSFRGRYGFIECESGVHKDIFVHQVAITNSQTNRYYRRTLRPNETVEFDIVKGKGGLEAANVTGPDGACVLGRFGSRHPKSGPRKPREEKQGEIQNEEGAVPVKKNKRKPNRGRVPKAENGADTEEKVPVSSENPAADADEPKRAAKKSRRYNKKRENGAAAAAPTGEAPAVNNTENVTVAN